MSKRYFVGFLGQPPSRSDPYLYAISSITHNSPFWDHPRTFPTYWEAYAQMLKLNEAVKRKQAIDPIKG